MKIRQWVGAGFVTLVMASAAILILLTVILAPRCNEAWIKSTLEPAFEKFESITTANYPDVEGRINMRSAVLEERRATTAAATWPLMKCRSTFIMHNPGTIHRWDEEQVDCNWEWFAD